MTLISSPSRFAAALLLLGAASCNEKVIVEEPKAVEAGEVMVGENVEPLYIGVWAADEGLCDAAPGEPGPVEFTATEFIGFENRCEILSSEEGTEGGWRLETRCTGEGETSVETFDVDLDGTRLRVWRNGGEPVVFASCANTENED